ncbi:ATP-binding protein [Anaerocolumna sp.]|uniref:ATP-binding protein n=1 Tax=Anaerocolumna sp. TaxID=2041569 RepID=UPI0028AC693F|nr:AAA family ATPase [Anaerocolumna sp.]
MEIKELRLIHFGKFHNKTIALKSGINLIYGENEAGKSTMHTFIRGMLFGIEKQRGRASKDDIYLKYQPWDMPGAYSGSMDIEKADKAYRIIRNFEKNTKSCTIMDIATGREINLKQEELPEFYGGLTESGYRNTISIEQLKAKTDQELEEEVRNYLANLSMSKSNEVDVTRAQSLLQEKRKELENLQLDKKIRGIREELEECLEKENKIEELTLQLKELERQEKLLDHDRISSSISKEATVAYEEHLNHFPVIREKYHNYCQDRNLKQALREKQNRQKEEQREILHNGRENHYVSGQLKELEDINHSISQYEQKMSFFIEDYKNKVTKMNPGNLFIGLIPAILCIISILLWMNYKNPLLLILAAIGGLGVIGFLSMAKRSKEKQNSMLKEQNSLEDTLKQLKARKQSILDNNHVASQEELKDRHEYHLKAEMSLGHLQRQIEEYEEQIAGINEKIHIIEEELIRYFQIFAEVFHKEGLPVHEISDGSFSLWEDYIKNEKQIIAELKDHKVKRYEEIRLKKEKIGWELKGLEDNEERLLELSKELQELEEQDKANKVELSAIKLAIETIDCLSVDIHDSFGGKLNELVSGLAGVITEGKYSNIKVDEKMNIKVDQQNNYIILDKLSSGTIGQLYLALRLAISDLVYGKDVMPILLDDCFALYDDNRTKAALKYLTQNKNGQIIIFTCHKREKEFLDEMQADYNYINLSS